MTTTPALSESADTGWFQYFPGNYRWSTNLSWLIGSIAAGGADMAEAHSVGRRLRQRENDDAVWYQEWRGLADRLHDAAFDAEQARLYVTASERYLRASHYYVMSQRFLTPWDEAGLSSFRKSVAAFHRFLELTNRHRAEIVNVPYGDTALPAYYFPAAGPADPACPCAVFVGGLGLTKEMKYFRGVLDLARRGISCLIVDGPGNGEALRLHNLRWRSDYEVPAAAMYDYLAGRNDIDPSRVALIGISAGGYSAARTMATDDRYAAGVVWGAIWNYDEVWARRFDPNTKEVLGLPMEYMCWVLGVQTTEEALDLLTQFRLEPIAAQITRPLLILHGTHDQQIPLEDAQKLFAHVSSEDKKLAIFDETYGGAQHCQSDYQSAATTLISDWLYQRLAAQGRSESAGTI